MEAMKEIPERYTNPFLSDEENEKVNLWNQELEHSNIEDTHDFEDDKLINSLASSEFCKKEAEVYTDKNVMECELPDSLICYKEGAFHVKDICVDEGIPHGEKIFFDENNNEMLKPELLKCSTVKDYYMESNLVSEINGKINNGLAVLEPSNYHMITEDNCDEVIKRKSDKSSGTRKVDADLSVNEPINDQNLQNSIPDYKECGTNLEVIDSIVPSELKEMPKDDISNGDGFSGSDTVSKAIDHNGPDISLQPSEEHINSSGISSLQQDRPLTSLKSLPESIDQQPWQNPSEKVSKRLVENESAMEGTTTLNPNITEPAKSSGVHDIDNLERVDELSIEPHDAPKLQDAASENVLVVNRGGEGESSFSVAGPISGLVTYSGHIGSTSLRSDSSTTSTRSFAFPILQNEWNSSPVRMAKADRRRLQKHRGWRHGLLCCRF